MPNHRANYKRNLRALSIHIYVKKGVILFAIYSKQVKEDHSVLFPPSFRYAVREPQSFRARITIAAPKNRGLFQSVQKHRISAKKRIWRATDASRLKTRIFSPTGVDLPKSAHTRKILRSAQCADAYFTNCANFNQFSAKAKIGDFDEGDFPYPRPENVITKTYRGPPPPPPPYEVATRSYRGTHRKGIRDARPSSSSATTRAREAPEDPFSPPPTDNASRFDKWVGKIFFCIAQRSNYNISAYPTPKD